MSLEKIKTISGRGVYIPGDDIDTDRIIPARFMKCVTFDGLGEYLFYDSRFNQDGTQKNFPLNDPRFNGATILIGAANFGCGSSREHAPQALKRYGFRAMITEGYAEIFYGNSITLGMPAVSASKETIAELQAMVDQDPKTEITIDIENLTITAGGKTFPCTLRESSRRSLINGLWDPIGELLEGVSEVDAKAAELPYFETSAK